MRSRTTADLPGRCPRCWVLAQHCVCAELPLVDNATEVLILRHEKEALKSSGTARIAGLILRRVQILSHKTDPDTLDLEAGDTWLLYPGAASTTAGLPPTRRLIVVDGTWAQSRRMLKRMPQLGALPWLSLPESPLPDLRLRNTSTQDGRSTLGAIAGALGELEGPSVAEPLHQAHDLFVHRVLQARGSPRLTAARP